MVVMIRAAQENKRGVLTLFRSSGKSTAGVNLVRRFNLSFIAAGRSLAEKVR
jgi:shikimate kinase